MTTLTVAHVTTTEAAQLIKKYANAAAMETYGIEIFTEPGPPVVLVGGTQLEGCYLRVRAGTDRQAGIGFGFLLAKM